MRHDESLAQVRERGEYINQEEAAKITTAVLQILSQRTTPGEAADAAAQLPEPLRAPLTGDGERQAESFGVEEFLRRVAERVGARPRTAEWDASAVLSTVADAVSGGELREGEPWFAEAFAAFERWLLQGGEFDPMFIPFFYGRWDEAAAAHARRDEEEVNEEGAERYGSEGAYDPPTTRAALAGLAAPVLVYAGELDGGPRPELARRTAEVFPNAEVAVQPGAGHYPWVDDPKWFVGRTADFFAGGGKSE